MQQLNQLANFVSALTFDQLPESVVSRAKWVVRDTVGVILAGMQSPEVRALADYAQRSHPGPATLLGQPGRVSPGWAALVHGTAGTTLELDEGHAYARGHPAIHTLPAALALAQQHGSDGREALTAFVAGYEVAARAGIGTRLREPIHPFGTWGVLGAAGIGARFHDQDAAGIAGTLELAASYAITSSFESALQGANVRNTYAGVVNRLGMLAADLYTLGFRGETGGLGTTFGAILGDAFDPAALVDGLGERFEIARGYFKPYSACRYIHAAIEAALGLRAEYGINPGTIDAVEVATYASAARLKEPAPRTPLAGRFSLPFVVAATLITGGAGPEIFTPEFLVDRAVLGLSSRVVVRENPQFSAMTPAKRPARMILHLNDGSRLEKTVMGSTGDPDRPMSEAELESKYHQLADPVIGAKQARHTWEAIGVMEALPDVGALLAKVKAGRG